MQKSSLIIIFLVVFLDLLGFGMVIPILPYYAVSYGATATTVGLLMMCYSGMQLLFSPFWGRISDRIGRRPVLLTCIAGISVAMAIVGLAQSLAWLFVGRLLAGFFGANVSTAAAYIADVTSPENRAKGMGLIGASFGLGFLFGPAFGGILSRWGYGTAALAAAVIAAANFIFAVVKLAEPPLPESVRREHRPRLTFARCWKTCASARSGLSIWLFFIATLGVAHIETTFALFLLHRFSLDAQHAGFMLAAMALVMVVIQGGAIGTLAKHFGESTLVLIGTVLMATALASAAASHRLSFFVSFLMMYALGYAVTNPSLMSLTSRFTDPAAQGMTMGVYQSAGSLARILGPLAAGWLFDRFGIEMPFRVAAGWLALAFVLTTLKRSVWETTRWKDERVMRSTLAT